MDILSQNVGDLKISPSVTNNYVNISIQNFTGPIQTEIYTLGGELADTQKGNKLSFEKLKSAVYFCVVVYQEKKKTIKIIKL